MIFSKVLPYKDIVKFLSKKESKIAIISCNGCARICGSGGLSKAEELGFRLIRDGYKVMDEVVVLYACSEPSLWELKRKIKMNPEVNTLISLACSAGWSCITRNFPNKKVINATEDVGLMVIDTEKGLFKLTSPYRKYASQAGNKYEIGTGRLLFERKIKLEAER